MFISLPPSESRLCPGFRMALTVPGINHIQIKWRLEEEGAWGFLLAVFKSSNNKEALLTLGFEIRVTASGL